MICYQIEPTMIFISFWDFLMVERIFFHHKGNEAWLLEINWYIRVAERVNTYDFKKLWNISKISRFYGIIT